MKFNLKTAFILLASLTIVLIFLGTKYYSKKESIFEENVEGPEKFIFSQEDERESVHPLSIEALRNMEFPGSEIVIERELEKGSNYSRYIASYQSEGLKIFALLTVPNSDKSENGFPAIVFNHGYIPPSQYRSNERYVAYVDGFARNGYIVFRPDYRGHGESEGIAIGAYSSNAYSIDVLNALASIKSYPDTDSDRIGIWGHSLGGFLSLRAMVVDPSIKAGVFWAGVVGSYNDIIDKWWARRPIPKNLDSTRSRWRNTRNRLRELQKDQELLATLSANSFLSDISGPIQLHHGQADASVPFELSQILDQEMKQAGKISELFLYPGNDHNLSQSFSSAMQRSVEFYNKNL